MDRATMAEFDVRLAASEADMIAAQRLRYEVFVEELGGSGPLVNHEARLERDRFDTYFDHLLLWDKEQVVGVYRLMREDRGWFSVSEVDVGVPVPPAMMGILSGKLRADTARDALLTGKRYTADEALAAGIVDGKASIDNLLEQSKALAAQLATKEPGIFKTLKQTWFGPMAAALVES